MISTIHMQRATMLQPGSKKWQKNDRDEEKGEREQCCKIIRIYNSTSGKKNMQISTVAVPVSSGKIPSSSTSSSIPNFHQ